MMQMLEHATGRRVQSSRARAAREDLDSALQSPAKRPDPGPVYAYARKAAAAIDVQAVALFGSRARSDTAPWSDYDIAVISESFGGMTRTERMYQLPELWEKFSPADIFGFTPEEFPRLDRPLLWEIAEYGMPVIDVDVFRQARQSMEDKKSKGVLVPTKDGWLMPTR